MQGRRISGHAEQRVQFQTERHDGDPSGGSDPETFHYLPALPFGQHDDPIRARGEQPFHDANQQVSDVTEITVKHGAVIRVHDEADRRDLRRVALYSRAARRPRTPALVVWVCSTCGLVAKIVRAIAQNARRSRHGRTARPRAGIDATGRPRSHTSRSSEPSSRSGCPWSRSVVYPRSRNPASRIATCLAGPPTLRRAMIRTTRKGRSPVSVTERRLSPQLRGLLFGLVAESHFDGRCGAARMATMADLRARIPMIYHFTDRRNLPSIREHEGIFSLELLESAKIQVAVLNGDNVSQATDRSKGLHKSTFTCASLTNIRWNTGPGKPAALVSLSFFTLTQ